MAETIHRALDALYLACIWVAGICIAVMSVIIPWGIFTRYVLGTGSQWPEPISILLMVVFTFLGAAVSYRAGGHIAVNMLTARLPRELQRPLAVLVHLLMLAISMFMLVAGTQLCIGTWGQSTPELPWLRVGVTYAPLPISGLVTLLFVLEHIVFGSQSHRRVVQMDVLLEAEDQPAMLPEEEERKVA